MERVRQEINSCFSVHDRRNKKLQSELLEKNETIIILRQEIEFLRGENQQKNNIIAEFSKSYHNRRNYALTDDKSHLTENSLSKTFVNDIENNHSPSLGTTETQLNDQLIAVRLKKHDDYIKQKTCEQNTSDLTKANELKKKSDAQKSECQKIYVCGDIIANGLNNNGLSGKNHSTFVKSFSGATSKDMVDFVKPIIVKQPDALVLHVGTNDLTKNVDNTGENLQAIIDYTKEISPSGDIFLSSICTRTDRTELFNKRVERKSRNTRSS